MMRHHTGSLNNTTRNLSEQQHFSALSLFRIVFVDISQIQFIYYKIPAIYEDILLNTKLRVFAIVVVVIILVFKGACLIKKRRLQCSSLFLKGAGDHHRFSLYLEKNLKMIMCHWAQYIVLYTFLDFENRGAIKTKRNPHKSSSLKNVSTFFCSFWKQRALDSELQEIVNKRSYLYQIFK